MLYIYDTVLEQIKKEIGDFAPERGGALLGDPGKPIVTKFIFDNMAHTTTTTYSPSRMLNELVQRSEKENELEFKGIIHSHPGSYDRPSGQDLKELKRGLTLNKHMPFYVAPIVTVSRCHASQNHEVLVQDMKVSFYAGFRQEKRTISPLFNGISQEEVFLKKMDISVIPKGKFKNDLEKLSGAFIGVNNPQVFLIDQEDEPMLAGSIEMPGLLDLIIVVKHTYPMCKPSILVTYSNGKQEEIEPNWDEKREFSTELEEIVQNIVEKAKKNRLEENLSPSILSNDSSSMDEDECRLKANTQDHSISETTQQEKYHREECQPSKPMQVSPEAKDLLKPIVKAHHAYNRAMISYQQNSFSIKDKKQNNDYSKED